MNKSIPLDPSQALREMEARVAGAEGMVSDTAGGAAVIRERLRNLEAAVDVTLDAVGVPRNGADADDALQEVVERYRDSGRKCAEAERLRREAEVDYEVLSKRMQELVKKPQIIVWDIIHGFEAHAGACEETFRP